MIRATKTVSAGGFDPAAVIDVVDLDFEDRRRRRLSMTGRNGTSFLVDLADVPALSGGDGFLLEDGRVVTVAAKPERLVEFASADPLIVTRIAWHLGNRHTPTELLQGAVRIRDDYVLVEMVKKLAVADIRFLTDAFTPEGGAYGIGAITGHDHADHDHAATGHAAVMKADNDPELAAAIERRKKRLAARAEQDPHVHGPDCGHDHGHDDHAHDHGHGHDHSHDHGHSHAGHSHHDHDHEHGHDHGHEHGHKHDHGHDHYDDHHDHAQGKPHRHV